MKSVWKGYFLGISGALVIACLSLPLLSHAAKVGDELVEKYHADMNGDGVEDTILLRKTVTFLYPFAPEYYDTDVVIEIINGKDGKTLFRSEKFQTTAIGVFVTSGKLTILSGKEDPARLEYVETTTYTEVAGPKGELVEVRKYLFEWNGKEIGVRVTSSEK